MFEEDKRLNGLHDCKAVFSSDPNARARYGKIGDNFMGCHPSWGCKLDLNETKNYKRVEDGIVSKNCANFPSMIMIFDRRSEREVI